MLQQYSHNTDMIAEIAQLLATTAKHEDVFESILRAKIASLKQHPVQTHFLVNAIMEMVKVAKCVFSSRIWIRCPNFVS